MTHSPHPADDVTQDAMLRALDDAASFRGGGARASLPRIVRATACAALPPQLIDPAESPDDAF